MASYSWTMAPPSRASTSADRPLVEAARSGDTGMIKLLVKRGADPNADDGNGKTPLRAAAAEGHDVAVALLREFGARR